MILDDLWYKITKEKGEDSEILLCLPCIEKRLNREITSEDLKYSKMNDVAYLLLKRLEMRI